MTAASPHYNSSTRITSLRSDGKYCSKAPPYPAANARLNHEYGFRVRRKKNQRHTQQIRTEIHDTKISKHPLSNSLQFQHGHSHVTCRYENTPWLISLLRSCSQCLAGADIERLVRIGKAPDINQTINTQGLLYRLRRTYFNDPCKNCCSLVLFGLPNTSSGVPSSSIFP